MLTEDDIIGMLEDEKPITKAQLQKLKRPTSKKKARNLSASIECIGKSGRKYRIATRQNLRFPTRFSVILMTKIRSKLINLIRLNGHHGAHPNHLEGTVIPRDTCHIHTITERYLKFTTKSPETYAEETDAYTDYPGAVDYMSVRFGVYVRDDEYKGGLFRDFE